MKEYLVGIDIGTTNVKAGLFSTKGELVSQGSASYRTYYPGRNRAEQNPEDWWNASVDAVRRMLSNVRGTDGYKILAISVSSQTPSLVAVDENGKPLRRAMIWMDRRADEELAKITGAVGAERFRQITGASPDVFYLLPKLYWYKRHEPENFRKTRWVLQANGYVNYCMTGEYCMDTSSALLTLCLDVKTGTYAEELEKAVGIKFAEIFPAIYENAEIIGSVNEKAAEVMGLEKGIPVVAGTTDTIAALLSFGLSEPGEAAEITGTSTLTFFTHGKPLSDPGRLMLKKSPLENIPTILNAPINATGASVKWYLENIGINQEEACTSNSIYEVFTENAKKAKPGSGGLIYFPYMMGERGPLWNSHAKGMLLGMTLDTTYREIARSILEGTAYALRHVRDEAKILGAEVRSIRASGGGAQNELWLEIKASVLNIPVLVPDEKCGNAILGDALLAGKAAGIYDSIGKVSKEIVGIRKVIEPNVQWVDVYEELYPYYRKMYEHLDEDLQQLEATMSTLYRRK